MKTNFPKSLLFIFCLAYNLSFSQEINNNGYIEYEMLFPNVDKSHQELATLIFNDSISIFTYRKKGYAKKNISSSNKDDFNNISVVAKKEDEHGSIIHRNFNKKEIVFRLVTSKFYNAKIVNDSWIVFDWKIIEEFKTIGKYKCQKAIGKFRGRKYTAWFTEEIPLPYGPWKLFGLPGLIIESYDNKKEFVAKLKSVQFPKPIELSQFNKPFDGENMTIEEFAQFQKDIPKIAEKKIRSKMPRGTKAKFGSIKTNFIEKEFEWESENKKE